MNLKIKVNPNSSLTKITNYEHGILTIKVTSPPIDGKANREIIKLLSKTFKVPQTSITFIRGMKSKIKTFDLPIDENLFLKMLPIK